MGYSQISAKLLAILQENMDMAYSVQWLQYSMLIALTIFVLALKLFLRTKRSPNPRLPPGPPKLPIIGNLHQLGHMPHLSVHRLAQELGPIIHLKLGSIPTVVVSSPRLAQEVLKTHDLVFANRPKLYAAKYLLYNYSDIGFAPYGSYWREARKICTLELLSTKQVQRYASVRGELVARFVNRIKQSCHPKTVNVSELIALYANDVICRISLGRDYSTGGEYDRHDFPRMIEDFKNLLGGFSIVDFFPSLEFVGSLTGFKQRMQRACRLFDRLFEEVIEEHRNPKRKIEEHNKDLVDVLLEIHSDGSRDSPLTIDNVKAIILDLFVAASDTTVVTMDWAMTELIMNPKVMKRVQAEVQKTVGSRKVVLESDLPNLTYLKAFIKEVLRLHAPAPFLLPRESMEDVTIDGYEIPAKTRILVNIRSIGRDPKLWENPEEFNPARFLQSPIDFKGQNFEFLPFGGGRRICPGILFALPSVELALAQLLHSFDWELPPNVKDLDLTEIFGLSLEKKEKLIVVAKERFI